MKKIFSKKSGFTLVEIIIAFAVFSIMATMIAQVLNLTINRQTDNRKYEENLQDQKEDLIAKVKDKTYDETKDSDGTLKLQFKDKDGNAMPMELDYQLRAADGTVGEVDGLNYFVGKLSYDSQNGEVTYIPGENNSSDTDLSNLGGSSQMSRFDTRITGTKGINSVKVSYTYDAANDEYEFTVTVDDSAVDPTRKNISQVSLFFGEDKANGQMATIKNVNGGNKDGQVLKYTKKSGVNGVNLHGESGGFQNKPIKFKVKFNEKLTSIGFGTTSTPGTYHQFTDSKGNHYVNIFGAYEKTTAPAS